MVQLNELNNKKFSKDLQEEKMKNEKLKNQLIEFKHTNSLVKMETDILGGRLNILTNSIKSLGTAKEAEEKSRLLVNQYQEELEEHRLKRDQFDLRIAELLKERETLHTYLKETNAARIKAQEEKIYFLKLSKE